MNNRQSRALHETIIREEKTKYQWQQANAELLQQNHIALDNSVQGFGATFGAGSSKSLPINKAVWQSATNQSQLYNNTHSTMNHCCHCNCHNHNNNDNNTCNNESHKQHEYDEKEQHTNDN